MMKVKPSIVLSAMDNYERILDEDGSHWIDKRLNLMI